MPSKSGHCSIRLLFSCVLTTLLFGTCKGPVVWNADVKAFVKNGMSRVESALSNLVVDGNVLPNGAFSFNTTSYPRGPVPTLTTVTFTATGAVSGQQIQYSWNGGSWTAISSRATSPPLTVIENTAVNTGTDNTLQVKVTAAEGKATTTYTVQFSKGYSITYDPNGTTSGGTAPTDSRFYEAGQLVTLLGNTGGLTETDGTFNGWNSLANGTGTSYPVASTLAMVSGGVTVYTRWQGTYTLGQTIAGGNGGIVFYDKGVYSNGWRFLAAAPSDQSTSCEWAPTTAATGATSWNVGDGLSNTQLIINANPTATTTNCAAYLCSTLTLGGYTWFLPSESELYEMYLGNSSYGLNMSPQWYWSSTQSSSSTYAMMLNLTGTGSLQPSYGVTGFVYVRAIREF